MITIIKDKNPNHIFAALKLCEQLYHDGDIPESVIEAFVEKIEVSKDCFRWHLRGDFGGDSPIDMNVEGNRKKGATISPQYIIPPANFGDSGCYKGYEIIHNRTNKNPHRFP